MSMSADGRPVIVVWQRLVGNVRGVRGWLQGGSTAGQVTQYVILLVAILGSLYLVATFMWGNIQIDGQFIVDSPPGDSGQGGKGP